MSDTIFLVVVALVGVGVGVALGILVASLRAERTQGGGSTSTNPANMVEIAKIWQDRRSGQPYPEVNGKIVRFPADITASQRERLAGTFELLLGWLKPSSGTGDRLPIPQASIAAPKPEEDISSAMPVPVSQPPKISPIDVVARAMQSDVRIPPSQEKSIALQIDDILQTKIAGTPMASQGIRLMESPTGDLVVMVGLTRYEGVDTVPDPEIQRLIREAAAEWEKGSAGS